MITTEQIANLLVLKVVFHDVPVRSRKDEKIAPVLSEVETEVDGARKALLKKKLVQALSSRSAYPIEFDLAGSATVANQIKEITAKDKGAAFLPCSQVLANELFSKQTGMVSPGLLCVVDARVDSEPCVILMKLERHQGAQLKLKQSAGKKTFSMDVLDDLVFTEGTRLFKAAMFVRRKSGSTEFAALACDSQLGVTASTHMAHFWLTFLGCKYLVDPRIATQRFFESSLDFVSSIVIDPTVKSDIYASLQSEIKSSKLQFSPKKFIEEYVPSDYQALYRTHLADEGIPLTQFMKDISNIERRLMALRYETKGGTVITVPIAESAVVHVDEQGITIKDPLIKVK
jgi:hypothetical protein